MCYQTVYLYKPWYEHYLNPWLRTSNISPLYTAVGICCSTWVRSVLSVILCLWVSHSFRSSFLSCRRSNTSRGPNVGIMLARHLRRWANVSPVLGYRVVFGATLNVCQRHRWRANINPASMKYWPGLNGYWQAPATLAQYVTDIGSVSACTRRHQHALPDPSPGKTRRWTSASLMLGQHCRWWFRIGPALGQRLVLTGHIVFCTSPGVKILKFCCPSDWA